jgi:hypothetical protein
MRLDGSPSAFLARAPSVVTPRDDVAEAFFDIQALRLGHFRTADGPEVRLTYTSDRDALSWRLRSHVMVHVSGFAVWRLTLSSEDNPDLQVSEDLLRAFNQLPWTDDPRFTWTVPRDDGNSYHHMTGGVRICLNLLFLLLHQATRGRDIRPSTLVPLVTESQGGFPHIHELCRLKELSHPYPVTFGTYFESTDPELVSDVAAQRTFINTVLHEDAHDAWDPVDVERDVASVSWYHFENTAFLFRTSSDSSGPGVDHDRTLLLQFLNLRRGALRSIQRDTQRVLSERCPLSRRRLQEWEHLLATTTDDYVLHDRVARLLTVVRERSGHDARVRSSQALEQQVRSNIDAFEGRLEAAASRRTGLAAALFSAVAAVLALAPSLTTILAGWWGLTDRTGAARPMLALCVNLVVALAVFVPTALFFRSAGSRVPGLDVS